MGSPRGRTFHTIPPAKERVDFPSTLRKSRETDSVRPRQTFSAVCDSILVSVLHHRLLGTQPEQSRVETRTDGSRRNLQESHSPSCYVSLADGSSGSGLAHSRGGADTGRADCRWLVKRRRENPGFALRVTPARGMLDYSLRETGERLKKADPSRAYSSECQERGIKARSGTGCRSPPTNKSVSVVGCPARIRS